jgi:hypothetical protein
VLTRATIACRQHSSATGAWASIPPTIWHSIVAVAARIPDNVDDWLTISPDRFDAHETHCKVLVARANKRGDYLVKFRCDDNLIQNYWFSSETSPSFAAREAANMQLREP